MNNFHSVVCSYLEKVPVLLDRNENDVSFNECNCKAAVRHSCIALMYTSGSPYTGYMEFLSYVNYASKGLL